MSWENELANEIKKRNNPPNYSGATVGIVVLISPLTVSVFDGLALLDDELKKTQNVNSWDFELGWELLLIPDESEQIFYIIDRIP